MLTFFTAALVLLFVALGLWGVSLLLFFKGQEKAGVALLWKSCVAIFVTSIVSHYWEWIAAEEQVEVFITLLFFLFIVLGLWGLGLRLFSKDRKREGATLFGKSFVVIIVILIVSSHWEWFATEEQRLRITEEQKLQAELRAKEERLEAKRQAEKERLEAKRRAEEARLETVRKKEERRKGFHCLSGWDGSHRAFKAAVKRHLRDPDSFEHIETRVTPADENGEHRIWMTYRARNGFGGMNVAVATGTYLRHNCNHVLHSIG